VKPSAAGDGTLVYSLVPWKEFERWQLTWVERSGKVLNRVGRVLPGLSQPRLSPDERRVLALAGESWTERDVWLLDIEGGEALPFTRSPELEYWADWGDGGSSVVFSRMSASGSQVLSRSVDGTTLEQLLFESGGMIFGSGRFLFGNQPSSNGSLTRGFISITDDERRFSAFPEVFQLTAGRTADLLGFTVSPDGRWLAYHSIVESGQFEVYVLGFPAFTNKVTASLGGGQHPLWHPNGSELFYLSGDGRALMSRKLRPDGSFVEPSKLFDLPDSIQGGFPWFVNPYTISKDGERFLMLQKAEHESTPEQNEKSNVRVVMNWFEEFRDKK
jgi:Tol biopolymer transport system component